MAVVKLATALNTIDIRGVYGKPNGCGDFRLGWSLCGDYDPAAGIYQRRHTKAGQILVRMRHYGVQGPRTAEQQAWRGYFATVAAIWHALPLETQLMYQMGRRSVAGGGYNAFLSQYMKSKPTDCGSAVCGLSRLGGLT